MFLGSCQVSFIGLVIQRGAAFSPLANSPAAISPAANGPPAKSPPPTYDSTSCMVVLPETRLS